MSYSYYVNTELLVTPITTVVPGTDKAVSLTSKKIGDRPKATQSDLKLIHESGACTSNGELIVIKVEKKVSKEQKTD